jgi:cell division septal protein FtsQ
VAKRLGSLRGRLLALAAVVIVLVVVYLFVARSTTVTPRLVASEPVAVIGSGADAVAVAADGAVLPWFPVSEEAGLPRLPLEEAPKDGQVKGPVLEQVRVLAATPPALSPYVEGSYFGESGVDVQLTSGVELRFGDAMQATRKWRAAAAVLADPSVTTLDYVDLHAPGHPDVGGSGHALPPLP